MAGNNRLAPPLAVLQPQNQLAPQPSWADAFDATSNTVGGYIADQRAQAVAAGLLDPNTGMPTVAGMQAAGQAYAAGMGTDANGMTGGMVGGIKAYHGSPHSFSKFDNAAIGTGEGAQTFGHGLYFAENEGVARSYRDALSGNAPPNVKGADGVPVAMSKTAQDLYQAHFGDAKAALDQFKAHYDTLTPGQKLRSGADETLASLQAVDENPMQASVTRGHMYEVNLNAQPEHFIDYDKPLSEQHPVVQNGVVNAWNAGGFGAKTGQPGATAQDLLNTNGGAVVRMMSEADPALASQALNAQGIPGIRYLDSGSRTDGVGTSNYVAFDPATIEIMRKYGLVGTAGAGAAAAANGSVNRLAPQQTDPNQP